MVVLEIRVYSGFDILVPFAKLQRRSVVKRLMEDGVFWLLAFGKQHCRRMPFRELRFREHAYPGFLTSVVIEDLSSRF